MVALEIRKVAAHPHRRAGHHRISWAFAFAILHSDPRSSWIASPNSIAWRRI